MTLGNAECERTTVKHEYDLPTPDHHIGNKEKGSGKIHRGVGVGWHSGFIDLHSKLIGHSQGQCLGVRLGLAAYEASTLSAVITMNFKEFFYLSLFEPHLAHSWIRGGGLHFPGIKPGFLNTKPELSHLSSLTGLPKIAVTRVI